MTLLRPMVGKGLENLGAEIGCGAGFGTSAGLGTGRTLGGHALETTASGKQGQLTPRGGADQRDGRTGEFPFILMRDAIR